MKVKRRGCDRMRSEQRAAPRSDPSLEERIDEGE
jgi:hypothetical protein